MADDKETNATNKGQGTNATTGSKDDAGTATTSSTNQPQANATKQAEEITRAAQATVQKAKTHSDSVSASKDRFVLGSAAGMSILNLTLLGNIIRDESESYMYIPLLVLISLAIALQIVIGILSLMISNVSGYFNQFKRDRGHCCKYLCYGEQDNSEAPPSEGTDEDDEDKNGTTRLKIVGVTSTSWKLRGQTLKPLPIYKNEKPPKLTLRGLQACRNKKLESQEAAIVAENNIEFLDEMISSTKAKLMPPQPNVSKDPATDAAPKSSKDTNGDIIKVSVAETGITNNTCPVGTSPIAPKSRTPAEIEELEKFADRLEKERVQQKQHVRAFAIDERRIDVYQRDFETEQEEKYQERKLYWQNIINYIAYCVVVLNAFIAALKPLADS